MTYVGLLYEGLIRSRHLMPTGDLPPVVPIVLYNGRDRWTAAQDIARLVAEAPGGLAVYRPQLRYVLIDAGRYTENALAPLQNLAAALFRLENSRTPEDVQQVLAVLVVWLRDPAQDSLRRAFTTWLRRVLLPARLPMVSIPEVQDFGEMQSMLAERVFEWTEQWKAEGLQQGLQQGSSRGQQGLQQGLQQGFSWGGSRGPGRRTCLVGAADSEAFRGGLCADPGAVAGRTGQPRAVGGDRRVDHHR